VQKADTLLLCALSSGQQNPDSIVNNKTMVQAYEKTLTSASFRSIWLCRTTLSRLIRNKQKEWASHF